VSEYPPGTLGAEIDRLEALLSDLPRFWRWMFARRIRKIRRDLEFFYRRRDVALAEALEFSYRYMQGWDG
jgi:hypothetical protein